MSQHSTQGRHRLQPGHDPDRRPAAHLEDYRAEHPHRMRALGRRESRAARAARAARPPVTAGAGLRILEPRTQPIVAVTR